MPRISFDSPILTKLDAHDQPIDYNHLIIDQYANHNAGLLLLDANEDIESCIDISTGLDTIDPHPSDHFWYRVDNEDAMAVRRSLIHRGLIRRVHHQLKFNGVMYSQYQITEKMLQLAQHHERSSEK